MSNNSDNTGHSGENRFIPSQSFKGSKIGYYFTNGQNGLGYYHDINSSSKVTTDNTSSSITNKSNNNDNKIPEYLQIQKNREEVSKRSRQWQTVDSDNESSSSSDDSGENDQDSDTDTDHSTEHKKKKHKKTEKSKKHNKDKSDSTKSKKHKKDKHKKDKHKKHKHKKDHESDRKHSSVAVNQNEFGKFGLIREEHFHQKQREFEAYMSEVKGMPGIFGQSKREVMKYFKDYIEDYNTATMPSDKYYNYEHWEMAEYRRKQNILNTKNDDQIEYNFLNDEENRKDELKKIRELGEQIEFDRVKQRMSGNKDQLASMRRQELLRTELKQAFKQGDTEKVQKLEKLLAPEEETATVKHPWA